MDKRNGDSSLEKIVRLMLEKWYIAVGCIFLSILAIYLYVTLATADKYQAYTTMYVTNASDYVEKNTDDTGKIDTSELVVNEMLAQDYRQIATSDIVLSTASKNLRGIPISRNDISITAYSDTRVLKLTVTVTDAVESALIANEITDCLIAKIKELTGNVNIKVIDKASVPQEPMSLPLVTYLILAIIAGIVLDIILVLFIEVFDTKVKGPEDLKERFNVPILALIPRYDNNGSIAVKKPGQRRISTDDTARTSSPE